MTPSNNNNGNPLILRILDSLGIAHQVAPVEHTHTISEITDIKDYTPVGIEGGDSGHEGVLSVYSTGAVAGSSPVGYIFEIQGVGSLEISAQTIANLIRASAAPSTTPENTDDKLITSKAVYTALAAKMDSMTVNSTPTAGSTDLVTSGGVEAAIIPVISVSDMDNKQGADGHYVFVVAGVFEDGGDMERRLLSIYTKSLTTGIRVTQVLSRPNGYQTRSARLFQSFGNWTNYEYATQSWVDTQLAGLPHWNRIPYGMSWYSSDQIVFTNDAGLELCYVGAPIKVISPSTATVFYGVIKRVVNDTQSGPKRIYIEGFDQSQSESWNSYYIHILK